MKKAIYSIRNPYIKQLLKLKKNQFIKLANHFLIEGEHIIEIALNSGFVETILVNEYLDIAADIEQILVPDFILEKLSSLKKATPIAVCRLMESDQKLANINVYLDDISDPGNVGTIIRSGISFGLNTFILSPKTARYYNEKVVQASQGAIFYSQIIEGDINFLKQAKKDGYRLVLTGLKQGAINVKDYQGASKDIIVFGNEGRGINLKIEKIGDMWLKIPIETMESLNVAIASGIIFHQINKKTNR